MEVVIRITSVILLLLSAVAIFAQEIRQQDKSYTVNVDVQLVQLPVSVLDKDGHPVGGLQKNHFQVFEDGVRFRRSRSSNMKMCP